MPAYQLGDSIYGSIHRVREVMPEAEVLVVNDGSDDRTGAEAERAASELSGVRVLHHAVNRGKGRAVVTGAAGAGGDVIVFLDGDLDIPVEQVPGLLDQAGDYDILVGTKHGSMTGATYPWKRRVLSRIFATAIKVLFRLPVTETQTGLKILNRGAAEALFPMLVVNGYAYDLELLVRARKAGYRIGEAPVFLAEGASSGSLRAGMLWELLRDTLRVWLLSIRLR
jgi:glycosyltransferase involved in cell wall biosynthesis